MSIKKISLSLLSAAALVGLVACGGDKPATSSQDPTQSQGATSAPTADVPTAEGKVTFYFTLDDDSVEIDDYASVYLAGAMTGWKTGLEAPVFTQKEGTKIYYVQLDAPEDASSWKNGENYDYQIVLGYNSSSNMAAAKLGLQWVNEYKFTQETSGTDNPHFEWDGTANTINLGTVSFATRVAAPANPLANVTVYVTLDEALEEGYSLYLAGSFNGWSTASLEDMLLTPNEDRTVFSKTFASLYAGNYEFQLVALANGAEASAFWDEGKKATCNAEANVSIEITDDDENGRVDLLVGDTTSVVTTPEEETTSSETASEETSSEAAAA